MVRRRVRSMDRAGSEETRQVLQNQHVERRPRNRVGLGKERGSLGEAYWGVERGGEGECMG